MYKIRRGFTLVELLVVIGIIAVLVGILLPALQRARSAAMTVKCATALREIGNAMKFYEQENRGYAPPCKATGGKYNLNKFDYTSGQPPYWWDFLAKYVTKAKTGYSSTTAEDATQGTRNVLWGCPAWEPYSATSANAQMGINVTQPGYGMNGFPEYMPDFPPLNTSIGESTAGDSKAIAQYSYMVNVPGYNSSGGWTNHTNSWYKFHKYALKGAERALVADSLFWFLEAKTPFANLNPNLAMAGQYTLANQQTWSTGADGDHQTTFDWYRHGKYPGLKQYDEFSTNGGRVSFNVLFADGHAATLVDRRESYKIVRMRFPG